MTYTKFFEWIQIGGVIGIWISVIYFTKLIINLKTVIDAQKSAIDSLKLHSDYFKNIHDSVRSLYDPSEISNLVNTKVEKIALENEKILDELKKENLAYKEKLDAIKSNLKLVVRYSLNLSLFMGISTYFLTDDQIDFIINNLQDDDSKKLIMENIKKTREQIKVAQREYFMKLLIKELGPK